MHRVDQETLRAAYAEDGYVVREGLLKAAEVDALRAETNAIVSGARGEFLGADVVRADGDGEAALQNVLAIHFPHKASALMRQTLRHPAIVDTLTALIGPDVKCMQSMLFVKNAGKPGQAWHQDEYYIPTRDRSLIGAWIALDDATIDNGCLWMHPGSHKPGVIWPAKPHGDKRFDNSAESFGWAWPREGGVPVEVPAGSAAFFNGYTLHRSLDNTRKSGFRRALVNHYMSARSMLPWAFGIPPTPREDFRDIELVAGEDPYAWKGTEELTFPFIRPEDPAMAAQVFGQAAAYAQARTTKE
jgi:ectoine hydroxylase-related dioxygenase (phytanoyl-CoA dioxygenase family)